MARPKQFDPDTTLDEAMRLFWEQGYEATSVQDLVERTGVHKRSMYDTFGDKHALFMKALSHYGEVQDALMQDAAAAGTSSATETIRAVLETSVPDAASERPRGCLFVNTATELGAQDPEAARRVKQHVKTAERMLHQLVERGQRDGDITTRLEPATLAKVLNDVWLGLRVQSRAGIATAQLRATIDAAMAMLAP
jgi:TetR/AcrR family transcriptional repressor of nem operon